METGTREVRIVEAKGGEGQRRSWKKMRREEAKREKDSRSKKNSGRVGNLE